MRSPFQVYALIKKIVNDYLKVSYLLNKKEFLALVEKVFGLDPTEDGKKLYKMLKVRNPQGTKMVNMLELVAVLILHSDFGHSNENDCMHNSELVEHKMNLLLILFDLRDSAKVNVVEVIIMARTIMQGFSRLYPAVKFFSNPEVIDEIRPTILALFREKIESEIKKDLEVTA